MVLVWLRLLCAEVELMFSQTMLRSVHQPNYRRSNVGRAVKTRAPQTALELDRVPGVSQCAAMSERTQAIARRTLQHTVIRTQNRPD
jgi:hypothetical protein